MRLNRVTQTHRKIPTQIPSFFFKKMYSWFDECIVYFIPLYACNHMYIIRFDMHLFMVLIVNKYWKIKNNLITLNPAYIFSTESCISSLTKHQRVVEDEKPSVFLAFVLAIAFSICIALCRVMTCVITYTLLSNSMHET